MEPFKLPEGKPERSGEVRACERECERACVRACVLACVPSNTGGHCAHRRRKERASCPPDLTCVTPGWGVRVRMQVYTFSNGAKYVGAIRNGKMHGMGFRV